LLTAVCELAADFHRQFRLRELQQRSLRWADLEQFSTQVHARLNLPLVAGTIANEGRRLIGCDRLMVVVRLRQVRVEAVSGVEAFDRRGNLVRRAESLTHAAGQNPEPFWYHAGDPVPPALEGPLADFLRESQARRLALVPLVRENDLPHSATEPVPDNPEPDKQSPCGMLILEWMSAGAIDTETRARLSSLTRQAALAVGNIVEHRSLPLFGIVNSLAEARWLARARHWPRMLWGGLAVAGVVAALLLIPADFEVAGRGELQPRIRQHVFAPVDGTVGQLHATHGQQVSAGETLLVLQNPDLDLEETRVLGEIQTTRKKLAAVQAARLESTPETREARDRYNRLTAEEEELREQARSLEQQHAILQQQRAGLNVRSPIAGQIVTWEVTQLLESRPVQRGQRLLSVADLDGPWTLEIEVPDHDVGHLLAAREQLGPDLPVSFVVISDPQTVHTGTVESVSLDSRIDEQQQASAHVRVAIDGSQIPLLRPGTTVIPRISCGRRSLGYVWFHRLIDLIRTRVLF
jgi:multidrug efflux pump subunit AcrA (membrane-fusion protein)